MNQLDWKQRFAAWQAFAQTVQARADAVTKSRHDKAWNLAATVGIPRCGCCLHNASIDDAMNGWCHNNPKRLKVAKRAVRILNDWRASRLASTIINRAYPR